MYFIRENKYGNSWFVGEVDHEKGTSKAIVQNLSKKEAEKIADQLEGGVDYDTCFSCRRVVILDKVRTGCPYCHRSWVD